MAAPHVIVGLLVLNALLQAADLWSTWAWVANGGSEYNFVSRWIMEQGGLGAWGAVKALVMAVFVGAIFWTFRQDEETQQQVELVALAGVAWMTFVVQSNAQRFFA